MLHIQRNKNTANVLTAKPFHALIIRVGNGECRADRVRGQNWDGVQPTFHHILHKIASKGYAHFIHKKWHFLHTSESQAFAALLITHL